MQLFTQTIYLNTFKYINESMYLNKCIIESMYLFKYIDSLRKETSYYLS